MAKKKNVEAEPAPEVVTKEQIEKMKADLAAQKQVEEDATAVAKAAQDALDAEAVELERASPQVSVRCGACGKEALLPAGTDVSNPARALKSSGMSLPVLGMCGATPPPVECLVELVRGL